MERNGGGSDGAAVEGRKAELILPNEPILKAWGEADARRSGELDIGMSSYGLRNEAIGLDGTGNHEWTRMNTNGKKALGAWERPIFYQTKPLGNGRTTPLTPTLSPPPRKGEGGKACGSLATVGWRRTREFFAKRSHSGVGTSRAGSAIRGTRHWNVELRGFV